MNGRKARERRRTEEPRTEDRKVHRLRPLRHIDKRGRSRLVGYGCDCCGRVFTTARRVSQPRRVGPDGVTIRESKAHKQRVEALRATSGVRGFIKRVAGAER